MTAQTEKVVFDCMIFTQALINPMGPAGACVELARARRVQLVISDYILQEVRELSTKVPSRFKLTSERVERLIHEVQECSENWADVADVYQNPLDPMILRISILHWQPERN